MNLSRNFYACLGGFMSNETDELHPSHIAQCIFVGGLA